MVPGMLHCGGGPGANTFGQPFAPALKNDAEHNMMRALEAWVEKALRLKRSLRPNTSTINPRKA